MNPGAALGHVSSPTILSSARYSVKRLWVSLEFPNTSFGEESLTLKLISLLLGAF